MSRPEQEMQKRVFEHIRLRSNPGVFAFHVPNGVNSSARIGGILKAAGVVSGVPDICIVHRASVHFLELKAGKNKPTANQNAVMNALQVAGARVAVASSLDEALTTLEYWGVIRRDRSQATESQSQQGEVVS